MNNKVEIAISEVTDGSMKGAAEEYKIIENRKKFLANNGFDSSNACLVKLTYDSDNFCRYNQVEARHYGEGIHKEVSRISDGLLTRETGVPLFLPLADCIGAVLWSKHPSALMVSHLGRHNVEQYGASESVEYFMRSTGAASQDIYVFLSAAAGEEAYPLYAFDNRSLHDVATEQLLQVGILPEHIEIDARDTTKDETLFSHSEFLKGHRSSDGRHMIAAMLV